MDRRHFFNLLLTASLVPVLRTAALPPETRPARLPEEPWRTDPDTLALWRRAPRRPLLASDDPHLSRLVVAVRANRPIRFRYHGGSTPAALREVTPGHLYKVDGFPGTYLSGYCHLRHAERTFLVERITFATTDVS